MKSNQDQKYAEVRHCSVTEDAQAQRLDNYLLTKLKGVPKSKIYQIIRKGEVRVNKSRKKPHYRLQVGDSVRIPPVRVADRLNSTVKFNEIPSRVISHVANWVQFEDKGLLVLNKPSGYAVHGGSGLSFGVIELLRKYYPEHQYLELVHRLDRDTSGLLLVAKKRSVLRELQQSLRQNEIQKTYLAGLSGLLPKECVEVNQPLRKNVLKSGERIVTVDPQGKPSVTQFVQLEIYENGLSLAEVKPISGRTHQIRVHAQYLKCPILNDEKYGIKADQQKFKLAAKGKLMLHANRLVFNYEGQSLKIESPMPERFQALAASFKR